jgi:preprotein translocase subunit SecB
VLATPPIAPDMPTPEDNFMASTNGGPPAGAVDPNQAPPQLNVLAQYVKDLSFENPNAPRSLQQQPQQQQPKINIQINVNAKPLAENDFEVELKIEGRAEATNSTLFSFDLLYAGIFKIQNVPQENVHAIVMIECPRLLFPFAREIIANAVRNGGFPPLMIDPVDFVSLYRQRLSEQAPAAPPPATA